jgi:integrase
MCPPRAQEIAGGQRRRSPITLPGYRKGQKPANAGKTYPAETYTPGEVLALLDACHTRGPHRATGIRNRALITVLWRSGLRIEEVLRLEPKDLNLDVGLVAVLRGKGGRRRAVPIDRAGTGADYLLEWLQLRAELLDERCDPDLAGPTYGPLFCVITRPTIGRRMHSSCVREALKDLAIRAGVRRRVHPHGLRHTFASEAYYHQGVQVSDLMLALGHSHPSTTDRYIHRIAPPWRLLEVLADRPWPDGSGGRLAA